VSHFVRVFFGCCALACLRLPTKHGVFSVRVFRDLETGKDIVVMVAEGTTQIDAVPVRVHDQCMTSEVFGSLKCDCREQLEFAQKYICQHGGVIIYLQQEGRGIGLANKIAAYRLQVCACNADQSNKKQFPALLRHC
jgi:GTP cyclohydrolase II